MVKFIDVNVYFFQCPQQTNTTDCGYFVMRFMKEIVMQYPKKIPEKVHDFNCYCYY
jgi:Ulp1 family protease